MSYASRFSRQRQLYASPPHDSVTSYTSSSAVVSNPDLPMANHLNTKNQIGSEKAQPPSSPPTKRREPFPHHLSPALPPPLPPSLRGAKAQTPLRPPTAMHTPSSSEAEMRNRCEHLYRPNTSDRHNHGDPNSDDGSCLPADAFRETVFGVPSHEHRSAELRRVGTRPTTIPSHSMTQSKTPFPAESAGKHSPCNAYSTVATCGSSRMRHVNAVCVPKQEQLVQQLQRIAHVREQMESLIARQKVDEKALVSLMQGFVTHARRRKECNSSHDATTMSNEQVVPTNSAVVADLQKAVRERNQALQLLNLVRVEGNAVVHRMHENLMRQHAQLEVLTTENAELRHALKVYVTAASRERNDGKNSKDNEAEGEEEKGEGADSNTLVHASCLNKTDVIRSSHGIEDAATISSMHNDNNNSSNELNGEPLGTLHPAPREKGEETEEELVESKLELPLRQPNNNHVSSLSSSTVSNVRPLYASIAALQEALRTEKRQRLEAEELSHKIAMEHQRHVALLEERLQRRASTNSCGSTRGVSRQKCNPNEAQSEDKNLGWTKETVEESDVTQTIPTNEVSDALMNIEDEISALVHSLTASTAEE